MIDGCTRISMLRKVMIPLMGPGILTAGIFLFLFAFQEYLTAAILTDTASKTVPVFITTQLGQTLPMLQQAGAAAILLTLPVIGIAFIAQRYLVAGLAFGRCQGLTDPLVLLPGLNCSPALWSALDIGAAMSPILTEPTLDGQVERLLDELPPRFALAGLSLGGIVAMALVRRAPERVSRLCLMSTTSRPPTNQQYAMWSRQRAALAAGRNRPGPAARDQGGALVPVRPGRPAAPGRGRSGHGRRRRRGDP